MTSSFSKSSAFKRFSVHTQTQSRRFQIPNPTGQPPTSRDSYLDMLNLYHICLLRAFDLILMEFARYLRNRKHVPCFYRVIETRLEVWENQKCCGNMSRWRVFPQLFRVLPNFHECFYNSIETRYMFSIS